MKIIFVLILFFISCERNYEISKAIVIEKIYHESYETESVQPVPQIDIRGDVSFIFIPVTVYHPEKYILVIEGLSGKFWSKQKQEINIDKKLFDRLETGCKIDLSDNGINIIECSGIIEKNNFPVEEIK